MPEFTNAQKVALEISRINLRCQQIKAIQRTLPSDAELLDEIHTELVECRRRMSYIVGRSDGDGFDNS